MMWLCVIPAALLLPGFSAAASGGGNGGEPSLPIPANASLLGQRRLALSCDAHCVVPAGETWVLSENLDVETLTIQGKLEWDVTRDGLELRAGYVLVAEGGELQIGTPERPMELQATVHIKNTGHEHPDLGRRFLGSHGKAKVSIHGRPLQRTWTLLAKTVQPGENQLRVKHDPHAMLWRVGDRIGIATTSQGESVVNRIRDIGPPSEYHLEFVAAEAGIEESIDGHAPASNAADGNTGTFWGSWCAPSCTGTEHWVSFDLGEPCEVKTVRVFFDTSRYAPVYRVQTRSSAGENWQTIARVDDDTGGDWYTVSFSSGQIVRYLRIYAQESALQMRPNKDSYAGMRIREVQAFGIHSNRALPIMLHLESPLENEHWGGFRTIQGRRFEMAAEVVNLERSVVITGDHSDFEATRMGLHTIMYGEGLMDVRYARVEYCGQRDILGRYCMHFHHGRDCPDCVFQGNAVVESQQVGITVHNTHSTLVDQNVLWDTRAAGVYTEDGNEMHNTLSNNAIICSVSSKCSVPWLVNAGSEVAGLYIIGMTNHIIGNHVAGWENALWSQGSKFGRGKGAALDRVCPMFLPFLTVRGNVGHDCSRFGLYLDNQRPRMVRRDADGYVLDMADCEEFTADGKDNGVVPANVVEDWFDWHNAFNGQYNLGDIAFHRYVSVNNVNCLYWKASKNFADGVSIHVLDSVFANDPQDPFGKLEVRAPSGPFTFIMKNVTFLGGRVGAAALNAGQHCGLGGAGGPCNVQYLFDGVDFSGLEPADARRIAFGIEGKPEIMFTPIFLARDNSLGGHRAMVSGLLDGFGAVSGCSQTGPEWGGAWACDRAIRRLNVWSTQDLGHLSISGPGYDVAPNMAGPVYGANAGTIPFEPMHKGYGVAVLDGERYALGGAWAGDEALELSDTRLQDYLGESASIDLEIAGSVRILRYNANRDFIGPFGMASGATSIHTGPTSPPTPRPSPSAKPSPPPTSQPGPPTSPPTPRPSPSAKPSPPPTSQPGPPDCGSPDAKCEADLAWAMNVGILAHPEWYPGLSPSSSPAEFQTHLSTLEGSSCLPPCCPEVSAKCEEDINWAMTVGILEHPDWYPGLSSTSSREDFQEHLSSIPGTTCPPPCEAQLTTRSVRTGNNPEVTNSTTAPTSNTNALVSTATSKHGAHLFQQIVLFGAALVALVVGV